MCFHHYQSLEIWKLPERFKSSFVEILLTMSQWFLGVENAKFGWFCREKRFFKSQCIFTGWLSSFLTGRAWPYIWATFEHLNKFNFPLDKDAMFQAWMMLAQWFFESPVLTFYTLRFWKDGLKCPRAFRSSFIEVLNISMFWQLFYSSALWEVNFKY